ncbi:MAG: ABC transporter permease [Alphaproteobacteria bacterium]|nr:ABC transporter permease [Alphaproteobacteria bacterium]
MHSLQHILRRALRSLWEHLYLNAMAALVIGAALLLMGVYLTVQYNLNAIVDTWDRDVHISAYFHDDVPEERRFAVRDQVAARAEVLQVRYVSSADAREWLRDEVEDIGPVLEELGDDALPASLEISLAPEASSTPEAISAFAKSLEGPDFEDLDYGQEWIERFNAFLSLLQLLGAVLGALIGVAALFLVANTVHLIVYNRRDELEVQKLVGATGTYITAPFLVEGAAQGLVGAILSLVGLWGVHRLLVVRLQEALQLGLAGELAFLPWPYRIALFAAGLLLGVTAAFVSVRRFLATAP